MTELKRRQELREWLFKAAFCVAPASPTIRSLARAVGVSNKYLYRCIKQGEVSPQTAKRIEEATGGIVKREYLNPRIFG